MTTQTLNGFEHATVVARSGAQRRLSTARVMNAVEISVIVRQRTDRAAKSGQDSVADIKPLKDLNRK